MRILTLIRQVLDAEESVRVRNGAVELEGSKVVMDTMDEYGVEEALRTARGGRGGGDRGGRGGGRLAAKRRYGRRWRWVRIAEIHVVTEVALDAIALSSVMAQIAKAEGAELIFCGGQEADWDSQALGAATAERLGWPQATWTSALELKGTLLVGKHEADEGSASFEVELPAVVTTQQGLNEPRYPTLPNIMKSKKKEIRKETLEAYGVAAKVKVNGVEIQVKERLKKILDGKDAAGAAAQLVKMLREEAGVIA